MVLKIKPSLKIIFLEYLAVMVISLVLAVAIPFSLIGIGTSMGLYTYANSVEVQVKAVQSQIASEKDFDRKLIPASCGFALLNKNMHVLQSNMDSDTLSKAVSYAKGKYYSASLTDCYLSIKRHDGYCILHYYIISQYNVKFLRGFPSPDMLLKVLIVINCVLACFVITTLFARRLKKHLQPLITATQKIKEQDLDFEVKPSGITEFNHILKSIMDMKNELKQSLEQQWRMQQTKKAQMSALTHDIKTPLTIIRGNAELLRDSCLTDEQREYTRFILKNADRMETYLKLLTDLTQAENGFPVHMQKISTDAFLKEIYEQAQGLAAAKQINFELHTQNLPQTFTADSSLLVRAVINVISNAVDYSPAHGTISFDAQAFKNRINFCTTDSGNGFSPADLKQAANQFYMGDQSRSRSSHFGLGLYIAKTIAELHNGTLQIANASGSGGGKVTIEISIA